VEPFCEFIFARQRDVSQESKRSLSKNSPPKMLARIVLLYKGESAAVRARTPSDDPTETHEPMDALIEHYDDMLRCARALLKGSTDSAEDFVQDACVQVLTAELPEIKNPRAYMLTVVSHKVIDYMRKVARERMRVSFDSEAMTRGAETLPEGPVKDMGDELAAKQQVEHLLKRLPPHLQAVLLLCRRDRMTCKEAGARLRMPTETVRKYLAEALALCRVMEARDGNGGSAK
jgi:RNA polymerase sigma factor (sigma-70 family)